MSVIDDYFKQLEEPQKTELERIRRLVKEVVPDASEVITYGMPGFKYRGKYLISFAAFKNHLSLFPGAEVLEALSSELGDHASSKGTVKFTLEDTLPDELVKKIVIMRANDIRSS